MKWTEVIYKCRCMKAEARVQVIAREKGEDTGEWFEKMQTAITRNHRQRSPLCQEVKMEYAKIELPPGGIMGEAEGGTA